MRISDWSSDVCSSDLIFGFPLLRSKPDAPSRPKKCKEISDRHPMGNDARLVAVPSSAHRSAMTMTRIVSLILALFCIAAQPLRAEEADARKPVTILISIRSEEHTSELQSLMRTS